MSTLDLSGLDVRLRQLATIKNLDATKLMVSWTRIIEEDNRRGVLAGLDKDGVPMIPVTYRPKEGTGFRVNKTRTGNVASAGRGASFHTKGIVAGINLRHKERFKETLKQFRLGQGTRKKRGEFAGIGGFLSGTNNNLSTAEYSLLGGPPLAPRDQFSRVITNLNPKLPQPPSPGVPYWEAICAWEDVVTTKGRGFLHYHFDGSGKLPRRDLRGVRPDGIQKAQEALQNWARDAVRTHFFT